VESSGRNNLFYLFILIKFVIFLLNILIILIVYIFIYLFFTLLLEKILVQKGSANT